MAFIATVFIYDVAGYLQFGSKMTLGVAPSMAVKIYLLRRSIPLAYGCRIPSCVVNDGTEHARSIDWRGPAVESQIPFPHELWENKKISDLIVEHLEEERQATSPRQQEAARNNT